jgi:nitroreductase
MATPFDWFQARYGAVPQSDLFSEWNESLDALLSHRSVRSYLSDPLPAGTLETLIAAAQSASTSSNLQTWSVVAVESSDRKHRLAQLAGGQAHIEQCPLFLVWLADLARLEQVAHQLGQESAGLDYLELFVTSVVDAALAAQNATVAAESMGLGTVYIGAMRNHPEQVAAELNLPSRVFAVFGLCVGYANPEVPASIKPRLPQSVVLHRETYSKTTQLEGIDRYNQVMTDFYKQQKMNVAGNWAEHSVDRIATVKALRGRDRLRSILKTLGFELL